jgi:hypothetical protein
MRHYPRSLVRRVVVNSPCRGRRSVSVGLSIMRGRGGFSLRLVWGRRLVGGFLSMRGIVILSPEALKWVLGDWSRADLTFAVMFGQPPQNCPDVRWCYCLTYGYCNMTDEDLQKQWVWRGLILPEGWPNVDPNAGLQKRDEIPSEAYWKK